MNNISSILELHQLAKEEGKKYPLHRFYFNKIAGDTGKHLLGICGLRGTGKSIILKQLTNIWQNSLYISLDSIETSDLFSLIKHFSQEYKVTHFLLDEVHFIKNIDEVLKKIYDFLNVKIVFTSSVSIGMFYSAYDLSRRVKLTTLFPFSFREYLYFKYKIEIPGLGFEEIIKKDWLPEHRAYVFEFEKYLQGGNMPFSLEEPDIFPLLDNILKTIIYKDIPKTAKLHVEEPDLIEKTVNFIGKSDVDGINYTSISKNIGITKFKAQSYIDLLEKAFVVHKILPAGTNVLKEPKILLTLPFRLLFKEYEECIGALREDFFIDVLKSVKYKYYYLKSTRGEKTPDYLVIPKPERVQDKQIIVEIGGKGKGREQFKGINEKKQIIFSHSDKTENIKRPLFLAGFIE